MEFFTANASIYTVVLFLIPVLFGVPIAIAMGATAVIVAIVMDLGVQMVSFNFFGNIASFPLLAIPFFVLAGMIFDQSGIAERLVDFIKECIGTRTGGFAVAAVLVATFWGAISGSGPATVAALGVILIPGMVKAGYNKAFSTSVVSIASGLAVIIPPSVSFILYATLTNVSISAMFAAGILPGFIMAACLCLSVSLTSKKHGWRGEPRKGNLFQQLKKSCLALFTPVLILGGIYGGIFTPTEAAAVAVFYGLLVGMCVYRTITLKKLFYILIDAAAASAVVLLLTACGGLYSWVATTVGLIDQVANLILSVSENPMIVLLTINIILLIMGMLVNGVSLFYVFTPILYPIVLHFNWSPIWFGVVMTMNLALGMVTPPVAANLFVGARISGLSIEDMVPWVIPMLCFSLIALALTCIFPELSLFLPRMWGLLY